jgi:hypothetical protein
MPLVSLRGKAILNADPESVLMTDTVITNATNIGDKATSIGDIGDLGMTRMTMRDSIHGCTNMEGIIGRVGI